jgi:hypothetical protein
VVYRTGLDGGVVGLVDFIAGAATAPHGGWAAEGVFTRLDRPLRRSVLLADDVLGPLFRYLRSRRRLPEPAARRLDVLLGRAES